MKTYLNVQIYQFALIGILCIAGCQEINESMVVEEGVNVETGIAENSKSAGVLDDFNDGVISDLWETTASDNASVYEANGHLNVDIGAGPGPDGWNQVAGIVSKEFLLQGDFDVQVEFQLSADYHLVTEANTKLILMDLQGNGLEISIRTGNYLSIEVLQSIGVGMIKYRTLTDHLSGKLRIARNKNVVITYFWENGWQKHAQWVPEYVSGDLKIAIDSWNWEPSFSEFSTKFDNVLLSKGSVTICHMPGTAAQKTLTIPADALKGHLEHGDYLGTCDGWIRNPANKHFYMLTEPMNWPDAEALAVQFGGHLVTLNSWEEELWLKNMFGSNEHIWIGLNDFDEEGNWVWSSGEPVGYTNWAPGEPNNANEENWAVMNWCGEGASSPDDPCIGDKWNDLPDGALRGVIEKK